MEKTTKETILNNLKRRASELDYKIANFKYLKFGKEWESYELDNLKNWETETIQVKKAIEAIEQGKN